MTRRDKTLDTVSYVLEDDDASLGQDVWKAWDGLHGNHGDTVVEGVLLVAGVDHPQVLQMQILNGAVHGAAAAGSIGVFELKTVAFPSDCYEQIQLGPGMGCPEIGIATFNGSDDMFQGKPLPRGPQIGMPLEICQGGQLKQAMEYAAVADVDFGGLDLPFSDVFEPGRKDSDHVGASEDFQIAAGCVL